MEGGFPAWVMVVDVLFCVYVRVALWFALCFVLSYINVVSVQGVGREPILGCGVYLVLVCSYLIVWQEINEREKPVTGIRASNCQSVLSSSGRP